jgi:hypothetical protein
MNDPSTVRPPFILYKTVEYIRECIVDLDRLINNGTGSFPYSLRGAIPDFKEVYAFIRDRVKTIS